MVLSSMLHPVYCHGQFNQLLWTCQSTVCIWSSLTWILAHNYNTTLVVLNSPYLIAKTDEQCWLFDDDDGCNRLELFIIIIIIMLIEKYKDGMA